MLGTVEPAKYVQKIRTAQKLTPTHVLIVQLEQMVNKTLVVRTFCQH